MSLSLKDEFPLRLIIGTEDCTFLLDDNFTFSSADPGGFEAASFNIPKDMPDTLRGTYVRMDCGLDVAWEGRVSEVQRSLGNKTAIQCEGLKALFADDDDSMVFVDRDLTQWQSPSTTRQLTVAAANYQLGSSEVAADPDNENPSVVQTITDSWASPYVPDCEAWYDAGPENVIQSIYYEIQAGSQMAAIADWYVNLFACSDANADSIDAASSNFYSSLPAAGTFTPSSLWRYALMQMRNTATPNGAQGAEYDLFWQNVAVYGNHGIPLAGPAPYGLYPSGIAQWVMGRIAGIQAGVVPQTDSTGYIMPHSVYYTPVGRDQMIDDMATAAGWHWGVWPSLSPLTGNAAPRCDFRPRPVLGDFTGFCLRRDTTECDIREDLSQQFNKAVITFSLVDGTNGAVTVFMDNPILDQAGIPVRTLSLNGGTMTPATAALFGLMALAYTYNQARVAGSVQIEQAIAGPSGPMAPFMLQPGIDRLRIGDLPSFDAWGAYQDVPISRMEFSGSSSGFESSIEVGQGADMVETLQARLSAATALSGVGA